MYLFIFSILYVQLKEIFVTILLLITTQSKLQTCGRGIIHFPKSFLLIFVIYEPLSYIKNNILG